MRLVLLAALPCLVCSVGYTDGPASQEVTAAQWWDWDYLGREDGVVAGVGWVVDIRYAIWRPARISKIEIHDTVTRDLSSR